MYSGYIYSYQTNIDAHQFRNSCVLTFRTVQHSKKQTKKRVETFEKIHDAP